MSIGEYRIEAFPIQVALYLEGIRVPFVSASVTATPNRPSVCTISLPPFASALRIRPRTLVDLFYLDSPFVNQKLVNDDGTVNGAPDPDTWRLLFTGEFSHHEVEETEAGRTVNLICLDVSNYWNHVYQYFINNQRGMAGAPVEIATFVNGVNGSSGQPLIDLATIYNLALPGQGDDVVLTTILGGRRNTIMAGMADLLVKIGGEASHNGVNDPKGVNRFFRDAERRLRMARRMFFVPDLQLANFMRLKADFALKRLLNQIPGELGGLGTVHDVIKKFQAHAFYDYVNFIAPPFGPNPSRDIRDDGFTEEIDLPDNLPIDFSRSVILGTMFKPKTFFLPPPRCNILYPSRVSKFRYGKSYLDEPTRLRLKIAHGLPGRNVPFEGNSIQELAVYAPPGTPNLYLNESQDTTEARTEQAAGDPNFLTAWEEVRREYGFYSDGSNLNFDPSREISEPETGIIPVFDTMDQVQAASIAELVAAGSNPATDTVQSKLQSLIGSVANQNTLFSDTAQNENVRNLFRYYLASANYQLDVRRYAQRSVRDIEGPFNPNLLVGFPAALLNSTCIVLGDLDSVRHTIDQSGARTTCFISRARNFPIPSFLSTLSPDQLASIAFTFGGSNSFRTDPITGDRVSSYKDPTDGSEVEFQDRNARDVPVFLNNKFTSPTRLNNEVYSPIFGTRTIFHRVSTSGPMFESGTTGEIEGDQYAAAVAQYVDYLRAGDKTAFVNFATRRNIATIDNVRNHYDSFGAGRPVPQDQWHLLTDDEYLYGGPGIGPVFKALNGFSATKQDAVRALTKDMRIALGKQPGVNFPDDINTFHHRSGGASGG